MFSKSMGLIRRLAELFLEKNKAYSTWYNIPTIKIMVYNAMFLSGGK
jgi:hypothetical protein